MGSTESTTSFAIGVGCVLKRAPSEALQLIGESMGPRDLVDKLLVDRAYYESSGGGVTFTGGEPTLHADFLTRVLELCSEAQLHTNLETAGRFSWIALEPALQLVDLIYFDLKILDPSLHNQNLGGDLTEILDNARRLVDGRFPVEFRMPVVPGHTDTEENITAVVRFLHGVDRPEICLLPYHNMGEAKIDIINGAQPRLGLARCSMDHLREVAAEFEAGGIVVSGFGVADMT